MEITLEFIIQTGFTIMLGAVTFFLKKTLSDISASMIDIKKDVQEIERENENKYEQLSKEFNNFKSDLPLIYVTREDYIRQMNTVEQKLDKMLDLTMREARK